MKTLLLATTNRAKREELLFGLKPLIEKGFKVLTLIDLDISDDPEETGTTFLANAKLKAEFYADLTSLPTLADDGGLMIDILNGEPGVKSRRWKGYEATDEELIEFALEKLKDVPLEKRTAQLYTCLYFYHPEKNIHESEEQGIEGWIAEQASGNPTHGYPYKSLFKVKEFGKYYDELTEEQHQQINHRFIALKRLIPKMEKYLLE